MTRVFAYCRVSTAEQTTDNQIQEIAAAGFDVKPQRAIVETISGSVWVFRSIVTGHSGLS